MGDQAMVDSLKQQAKTVRKEVLTMIHTAGSGHPGGSLSAADIMTALYFHELNIRPEEPKWDGRDRFVLSKGHVCPVLYTCLALRGYFDKEILGTLRREGSILQGHPDMKRCPGIDISTGSLVGDGEAQEGQVWEAAETASKYELDNLIIIVDNNGLQNDGPCDAVMPTRDLAEKFKAFGCNTYNMDGHNMDEILDTLDAVRASGSRKPHCIVAKTVKGKGVSFMENIPSWHGMAPNDEEYARAIADIEEGF